MDPKITKHAKLILDYSTDTKKGDNVLIQGCGISGLMNIVIAKLKGAYVTATDIDPFRLKKAKEFGADNVIDVSKEKSDIRPFSKSIDRTGL